MGEMHHRKTLVILTWFSLIRRNEQALQLDRLAYLKRNIGTDPAVGHPDGDKDAAWVIRAIIQCLQVIDPDVLVLSPVMRRSIWKYPQHPGLEMSLFAAARAV